MSRPRDRHSALGLLPRMEARVGKRATSYRYRPIGGKVIPLGTDKAAALRRVLDLEGVAPHQGTLRWVWEKYSASRRYVRLAEGTRVDYVQCWAAIGPILGGMPIAAIDSPMVARYMRVEREDAPGRANHEKALLSNLFAHGIDLGVCTTNPAKQVRPNETESRTKAPKAAVLGSFLEWVLKQTPQRRIVGLAAQFAALEGSRQVEFLGLTETQVDDKAGIVRMFRAKQRGKKRHTVVEEVVISPALAKVIAELRAMRSPKRLQLALFPQRNGNAYTARGFKTLWQRVVLAAIAAGVLQREDRFTFHDLRAFYATRHKAVHGKLPDLHRNPATTAAVYDRTEVVRRDSL